MTDERLAALKLLGRLEISSTRPLALFLFSLAAAAAGAWLPFYEDIPDAGREGLFILYLAALLWLTEAIPAFAVALVILALAILLLADVAPPEVFLSPWSSSVIWLFFGGFVLAAAAVKSGLDRWLSGWVISVTGSRPDRFLLGVMGSTFAFSMFMSNTATATMMLSLLMPLISSLHTENPLRKSLPLGIAFAANLGGMSTIIGSPPNAIAAGLLEHVNPVSFFSWSLAALPVALTMAALSWFYLRQRYATSEPVNLEVLEHTTRPILPIWQRLLIMAVFALTVCLWLTGPLHQIPILVISFIPITLLTVGRVISSDDIRQLPWDVLLLITGGLCLGEVMSQTGLTDYLVSILPIDSMGALATVLGFAWACSLISNFMSNTAAANILLPLALAMSAGQIEYVIPVALAASSAMCMPVSTPPNALAASRAGLGVRDFLPWGLIVAVSTTPIAVLTCYLVFG